MSFLKKRGGEKPTIFWQNVVTQNVQRRRNILGTKHPRRLNALETNIL
jgi:hypothetical protein